MALAVRARHFAGVYRQLELWSGPRHGSANSWFLKRIRSNRPGGMPGLPSRRIDLCHVCAFYLALEASKFAVTASENRERRPASDRSR
jgi:hypothetical protein